VTAPTVGSPGLGTPTRAGGARLVPEFARGHSFLTPAFRLELEGRDTGRHVVADVLEVSFTDDLDAVDSFEFTVHDWDPVARRPRYSSPWDAQGRPLRLAGDGSPEVPNFEPGAQVSLYLGYLEDGELPLVLDGEVVSLTPSFPGAGAPTCRVRALDAFLRRLQRTRVEGNYSGTPKEVVDQLCRENGVAVRWATLEAEGAPKKRVEVEGTLLEEVTTRAQEYGLSVTTQRGARPGDDPVLYLARPAEGDNEPVATLTWGRTLVSFSPVLSAAGQVAEVVVRGADPGASEDARAIEVRRTWSDIGLAPDALGPAAVADLRSA
jgi:phage protein D